MGYIYKTDAKSVFKLIEVQKSETILRNIPDYLITQETCLASVKANGLALKHVPICFLTKTLIFHAIKQNPQSYFFINNDMQEQFFLRYSVRVLVRKIKEIKIMNFKF